MRTDFDTLCGRARRSHRVGDTELCQRIHAVRAEVDPCAYFLQLWRALEDGGGYAHLLQGQAGCQPAYAAADDDEDSCLGGRCPA